MTAVTTHLLAVLALIGLGGASPWLPAPHRSGITYVLAGLLAAIAAGVGIGVLATGSGGTAVLPVGLPGLGWHLRIDALSAVFIVVINAIAAIACLYAVGYGRHEPEPLRVLPFVPPFIAAMNLVLVADDAFAFLVSWETMSLASWVLVVVRHQEDASRRAGHLYLVMASFGTLALIFCFGTLAGPQGDYGFDAMRGHALTSWQSGLALAALLVGVGSKAGLVPLHVWLPLAHPAAPSHVSALMSGVMTKVAVYGAIRIGFELMGSPAWWWALPFLLAGAATAVIGLFYAILARDLKTLLAYSTIENLGIIFIALGLALAFRASNLPALAGIAMIAALVHVINHAAFKSLLFFGAGAVIHGAGSGDLDALGGLIHRLKVTALLFLVGAAAISALPPLNGFASEWLLFQTILASAPIPHAPLRFLIPGIGAMLAFAAALAAACFVRAYGMVFLGRARTPAAAAAHEVDRFSLAAMGVLAAFCVLGGVLPAQIATFIGPAASLVVGQGLTSQAIGPAPFSLTPLSTSTSSYNGMIILIFLAFSGTLTASFIHRFATRATRRSDIWDCGYPDPSTATQYSAASFAMPIRRVFTSAVFPVVQEVDIPAPGDLRRGHFRLRVFDPAWRYGYGPLLRLVLRAAGRLNHLQFLTIRRYLTLTFSALILLLLVVAAWR
jgi:hydrogenase-4 component B